MQHFINISAKKFTPDQWAALYDCQIIDTHEHSTVRRYNVERSMVERVVQELEERIEKMPLFVERSPGHDIETVKMLRGAVQVLQGKLGLGPKLATMLLTDEQRGLIGSALTTQARECRLEAEKRSIEGAAGFNFLAVSLREVARKCEELRDLLATAKEVAV